MRCIGKHPLWAIVVSLAPSCAFADNYGSALAWIYGIVTLAVLAIGAVTTYVSRRRGAGRGLALGNGVAAIAVMNLLLADGNVDSPRLFLLQAAIFAVFYALFVGVQALRQAIKRKRD